MKLIPTSTEPVTITLYRGVPFDNKYEEHTLLNTNFTFEPYQSSSVTNIGHNKEDFLNMMKQVGVRPIYVFPRTTKTDTFNFAYGNGIVTSVVMELRNEEINSNYMKVTTSIGGQNYYYFITGITQKNESTYLLNLELDVFMTYGDEFLDSIENKPVMVERKHCRRILKPSRLSSITNSICYNQESTFNGIKNSIVQNVTQLQFKNYKYNAIDYNSIISKINWCYVIRSSTDGTYKENDIEYPYVVDVFPLKTININFIDQNYVYPLYPATWLQNYVGDPRVLKIIISPFPPYKTGDNLYFTEENDIITLNVRKCTRTTLAPNYDDFRFTANYNGVLLKDTTFYLRISNAAGEHNTLNLYNGFGGAYHYQDIEDYLEYEDADAITITDDRDTNEFKLQIAPFKELKMSCYYGNELYVDTNFLLNGKPLGVSHSNLLSPVTIASSNPEVNSFYNYVYIGNYEIPSKKGVSNAVSYNFPTAENALELFNTTQRTQFDTSKSNATLSNGFKMVTGTLMGGLQSGSGQEIKGMGTALSGLGGGIISEIQNIRSYNAKLVDLTNTPDKYSFGGSSYPYDMSIAKAYSSNGTLLPYMITYTTTKNIYEMSAEFLYHYGYEFNNESYFSRYLTMNTDNIFERTIFNYVKIRENITTKLVNGNLPLIVAQKMNEVLNAGIKFWTFFGMDLSTDAGVRNILNNYFQKTKYCNAEYNENAIE